MAGLLLKLLVYNPQKYQHSLHYGRVFRKQYFEFETIPCDYDKKMKYSIFLSVPKLVVTWPENNGSIVI